MDLDKSMSPWMDKAIHALRTGQPRLAELYMRRGLRDNPQGARWLRRLDYADATRTLAEGLGQFVDGLVKFFTDLTETVGTIVTGPPSPLRVEYELCKKYMLAPGGSLPIVSGNWGSVA